jgi:iron complex transport system ATP-binding protein
MFGMKYVIDMEDVTFKRENINLLKKINWKVREGEHWAILGLNGSGKTTLLNIINGYIWPSKGKVSVLKDRFGSIDLRELRKSIGWVSSSLQEKLYGTDKTQNIVVSGKYATIGLYETPTEEDIERGLDLMTRLGCGHVVDRSYQTCSQGEKQKLLIARALMASPKLLILDEPCNGLDIFSREQLLSSIELFSKQPDAPNLIYVTHHIEEIVPAFSHTLLVRRGEIYMAGKTKAIITENNLSHFFEMPVTVNWRDERAWLEVGSNH